MPECEETTFRGGRGFRLTNGAIELTLLTGGGRVASLRLAGSDMNPSWEPPWLGIEPEDYAPAEHPEYGQAEGRLPASVAGHFLCLDHFGELSPVKSRRVDTFTEAPNRPWHVFEKGCNADGAWLSYGLDLPEAGLRFQRRAEVRGRATGVWFAEEVTNLRRRDVPLAYQQHGSVPGH
jgi:hypothetical protein